MFISANAYFKYFKIWDYFLLVSGGREGGGATIKTKNLKSNFSYGILTLKK